MSTLISSGYVVSGSFSGKHVYDWNLWKSDVFMIVSGDGKPLTDRDRYGLIEYGNLLKNTQYNILMEISKETVEYYDLISAAHNGVNPGSVLKGTLIAGPIGGLIGAANSVSDSIEVLIHFKNGKESVICFTNQKDYQKLQRILYGLDRQTIESKAVDSNNKDNPSLNNDTKLNLTNKGNNQSNNYGPVNITAENFDSIIDRIFIMLEDGEWDKADYYCEQALNFNPKLGKIYLAKLMAELKVNRPDDLKNNLNTFDKLDNAIKASRYDSTIAEKLKADNQFINERNRELWNSTIYKTATMRMKMDATEEEFKFTAKQFSQIKGYKDADKKAKQCLEKAETARKDAIYSNAKANMGKTVKENEEAIKLFESIIDWKDSRTKIDECNKNIADIKIAEEKAEAERKRKAEEDQARNKKIAMIVGPIAAVLLVFIIVLNTVILPARNYKKALAAADAGNYSEAYSLFNKKPDYKDTKDRIAEAKLKEATALLDAKKYDEAYEILNALGNRDAVTDSMYARATEYLEEKDYDNAYVLLNQLGDTEKIKESILTRVVKYLDNEEYENAVDLLEQLDDVNNIKDSIYEKATYFENEGDKIAAYILFKKITGHKNSNEKINQYENLFLKYKLNKANIGDEIVFGKYAQNDNGKEDIKWIVLAKEKGKMLVISKYLLDYQAYNTEEKVTTWETCSLRKWLNNDFYNSAFSDNEKKLILTTSVKAEKVYSSDAPGNNTKDKVFILNSNEAEKYFSGDNARRCSATSISSKKGHDHIVLSGNQYYGWWLRQANKSDFAPYVDEWGDIKPSGVYSHLINGFTLWDGDVVNPKAGYVRPVIWIEI